MCFFLLFNHNNKEARLAERNHCRKKYQLKLEEEFVADPGKRTTAVSVVYMQSDGWKVTTRNRELFFVSKEFGLLPCRGDRAVFVGKPPVYRGIKISDKILFYKPSVRKAEG